MFDEDSRSEPFRPLGPGMRPIAELPRACLGDVLCVNDRIGSTRIVRVEQPPGHFGGIAFYGVDGAPVDAVEWRDATDEERGGFEEYLGRVG
jgi:hypothetical protein